MINGSEKHCWLSLELQISRDTKGAVTEFALRKHVFDLRSNNYKIIMYLYVVIPE